MVTLGNSKFAEAIFILTLKLKVTKIGIPRCWYDQYDWADQDNGSKGPARQLLLGADCTKLFLIKVLNRKGNPIMTDICTLL